MARMREIGVSFDKGYRDDLNYNFGLLEALIGEANGLTDNLREEILEKIYNLQQQIDMLTGENIGELLERLNDSIQQALTAAQDARTAKTATEEATALAKAATELANASALLAEEKANYANEKAVLAQEAADNANQEASTLSQLKIDVVQATQNADTAAGNANQATQAAQTATNAINVVLPNVEGLVNLKEWNTETQYKKNNFVTLEGNGYMALRDNKGVKPPSFPVLSNADWAMFVQKGEKGEQGTGVRILGTLPDENSLPPIGEPGDAYMVGEQGNLYVWQANEEIWQNVGPIKGPKGDTGPQGPEGPQGLPGKDADLTEVNQEIANLQQTVTDNQQVVTEHLGQDVLSENGAHGIRYFNDKLAYKDGETWLGIETGGEVYQENLNRGEKSNAFGSNNTSLTPYSLTSGINSIATAGTRYFVDSRDDTLKTLTLRDATGIVVGSSVILRSNGQKALTGITITNVVGATITVDTNESIATVSVVIIVKETSSAPTHAFGQQNIACGENALAAGVNGNALGYASIALGSGGTASNNFSATIGSQGLASGSASLSIGTTTEATGNNSFSSGSGTKAKGNSSIAEGSSSEAIGDHSRASGYFTTANDFASMVIGRQNKDMTGSSTSWNTSNTAFVIGNGQGTKSNAFRVMFNGNTYGFGAWNSTGADYAEFFEWLDGNLINEDRVGFVVTLDGDKIRKATVDDKYILGIISANPSVIGDSYQDDWNDKYVVDEWGRIQHHYVDLPYETGEYDEGIPIIELRKSYVPIISPNWDSTKEYVPREKRKEWSPVGLMGKLLVRDDGTCEVNSYAKVGAEEGILTASDDSTDMRVIERVAPNIVRVFIK